MSVILTHTLLFTEWVRIEIQRNFFFFFFANFFFCQRLHQMLCKLQILHVILQEKIYMKWNGWKVWEKKSNEKKRRIKRKKNLFPMLNFVEQNKTKQKKKLRQIYKKVFFWFFLVFFVEIKIDIFISFFYLSNSKKKRVTLFYFWFFFRQNGCWIVVVVGFFLQTLTYKWYSTHYFRCGCVFHYVSI